VSKTGTIVIVTGDDFGLSSLVNGAIIQAHRQGVLTSASLMVNGGAFHEAVALAKANPRLGVGIHITLVRGASTLSPRELFPLVDNQGQFSENPVTAGLRYFFEASKRPFLEKEIDAQIQKFLSTGLLPSHIDGHLHLHVHPTILEILSRLARKYAIPAFRLPREPLAVNLKTDHRNAVLKCFHCLVYRWLCAHAQKRLRPLHIRFPDRFFGLLASGHMDESYLLAVIDTLGPGVTEMGLHPALSLPYELKRFAPHYEYEKELEALLSPRVKERFQTRNIQLANYHCLTTKEEAVESKEWAVSSGE
jgi:hopanoid biosynthesis associated protein HpnK